MNNPTWITEKWCRF